MNTIAICEKCGTKLDRESELPCPGCLMKLGMANWGDPSALGSELPATRDPGDPNRNSDFDSRVKVAEIVEGQFPGLEIVELLGEGGMGMVFKARQTSLERDVAIKVIKTDHQHREAFENRFAREAKALASLNHPNIVTVHDFGKTDNYFFLIMEFVDGINMRELLSGQKISPRHALEIIPQICDALQYAHDQGVVHRDIKPENILVDRNGRVKIADYGLAKLINDDATSPNLTRTHHVMGTPHYMAPEQVEKPLTVDHRADIYSLGVVIYEMLTGELPLGRFDLPSEKAQVDQRLDQIVIHSLEKEPDRRYQQASEVKTDFQSIVQNSQSPPPHSSQPNPAAQSADRKVDSPAPGNSPGFERPADRGQRAEHAVPIRSEKPIGRPLDQQHVGQQKPVGSPHNLAGKPRHQVGKSGKQVTNRNPYDQGPGTTTTLASIFSLQTYLNATYLMISFPLALIGFLAAIISLSVGIPLTIIWVGFFILFAGFHLMQLIHSLERSLCRWLLKEDIHFRSPMRDEPTRLGKLKAVFTSPSTWWGILYSMIRLPWSIICFTLVLIFFTVPLCLLAAPIMVTQWWFQMDIASFEINTVERAILAALMGLPLFYVGIQITNGLAYASKKMSKFFLSRY